MKIFEIVVPGTWIELENSDESFDLKRLLDLLEDNFLEANIALNLFEQCRFVSAAPISRENWELKNRRQSEIKEILQSQFNLLRTHIDYDSLQLQVDAEYNRELWARGEPPPSFVRKEVFMFARCFIGALDAFEKSLSALSGSNGVPEVLKEIHVEFLGAFPNLRGVRNSVQHAEDRSRGLGANKKPIALKPVKNSIVDAPGGALMRDILRGTNYGNTMADGHFGEVDVSSNSMRSLTTIYQKVLDAFDWTGPCKFIPQ